MNSCPHLDPASLLAQSAVNIRLGRRACGSSVGLLAKSRRGPLHDNSIQGSIKQASTNSPSHTQVLQQVSVEHLVPHEASGEAAAVPNALVPDRRGRQRVQLAAPRGSLQVADVGSESEPTYETLVPPLKLESAGQHVSDEPQKGDPVPEDVWMGRRPVPSHRAARANRRRAAAELSQTCWSPVSVADTALAVLPGRCGSSEGDEERGALQQTPLQEPWPHDLRPLDEFLSAGDSEALISVRAGRSQPDGPRLSARRRPPESIAVDQDPQGNDEQRRPQLDLPLQHGGKPQAHVQDPGRGRGSGGQQLSSCANCHQHQHQSVEEQHWSPAEPYPDGEAAARQAVQEGAAAVKWDQLHQEMLACRTVQSMHRFVYLHRPRLSCSLLGAAAVHLSHLVVEDPPDGPLELQMVATMLDDVTQRLRGRLDRLPWKMLVATVCALSKLRCYDGPLLREAAALAKEQAAELTMRQAAGLIWAFGRYHRDFRLSLEPNWAARVLEGVSPRLHAAYPAEVAMALYGLALLRDGSQQQAPPMEGAIAALLDASEARMDLYGGRELSMVIWALARMRVQPGSTWLRSFLRRCEVATRTFVRGVDVANVLYGMACLDVRPPVGWMRHFMWQAQRRMNTMDAQALVMLAYALARMHYRPDRKWATVFLRYTRASVLQAPPNLRFPGLSTQQLAALGQQMDGDTKLAAARRQREQWAQQQARLHRRVMPADALGLPLPQAQLQAQGRGPEVLRGGRGDTADATALAAASCAGAAGSSSQQRPPPPAQAINVLLWSLVRLNYRPRGSWMLHLCNTVQTRLSTFAPSELALLVWALARLDCCPHQDWMLDYFVALRGGLGRFQTGDCVQTLWALSCLCHKFELRTADGEVLNALARQLEPQLGRMKTTTQISMLVASTRLEPPLPPTRLMALLAALLDRVRAVGFHAAGEATEHPTASAVPGYDTAEGGSDGGCRNGGGSGVELEAAQTDQTGGRAAVNFDATPQPLTARQCVNAVFAVGAVVRRAGNVRSVRQLCGMLLSELLPRVNTLLATANGADLVLLLRGIADAGLRLSPTWMRRHEARVRQLLDVGHISAAHLKDLQRVYKSIGYEPGLVLMMAPMETVGCGATVQGPGKASAASAAVVTVEPEAATVVDTTVAGSLQNVGSKAKHGASKFAGRKGQWRGRKAKMVLPPGYQPYPEALLPFSPRQQLGEEPVSGNVDSKNQ